MKEHPILFSAPMVVAILGSRKTVTRRVVQNHHSNDGGFVLQDYGNGWWPYRSHDGESGCYLDRQKDGDYYSEEPLRCPYGQPGDRLWVRETYFAWGRWETRFSAKKGRDEWHFIDMTQEAGQSYLHAADGVSDTKAFIKRRGGVLPMYWKRPAIFMPRAACRLVLEVTGVRVERLQDISEADALAEGTPCYVCGGPLNGHSEDDCHCFHRRAQPSDYRLLWESINGPESWAANPWVWVVEFKVLP